MRFVPILVAFALVSCSPSSEFPPKERPVYRMGMDIWPGFYPGLLIGPLGLDTARGFRLQVDLPQSSNRMMADFSAGQYDAICTTIADVIHLHSDDTGVRLLLVTDESTGGDRIYGHTPLPSQLSRKIRVGVNMGGVGEFLLDEFRLRQGWPAESLELVQSDGAEAPEHMETGHLDAVHTWAPYCHRLDSMGKSVWFTSRQTPGVLVDVVVIHRSADSLQRRLHKEVREAWFLAVDWIEAHPDSASILLSRTLGRTVSCSFNGELALLDRARNESLLSDTSRIGLRKVVERYNDFFVKRGRLLRRVVASRFLDWSSGQ